MNTREKGIECLDIRYFFVKNMKICVFTSSDTQFIRRRAEDILCSGEERMLTNCGRVTQICVFNTAKLGTSASSP